MIRFDRALRFACSALLVAVPAAAQLTSSSHKVNPLPIATVTVAQGKAVTAHLPFRVPEGLHINSNTPGSDLLIPTTLKLEPPTDISLTSLTYPKGEDKSFEFSPDTKLNVYSGDFTISVAVNAARSTPVGKYRVHGTLRYQACDDRQCFPPASVPMSLDVTVVKGTFKKTQHNPPQSPHVHN